MRNLLGLVLVLLLGGGGVCAQTGSGSVQGTVKDATGAVIPVAKVWLEKIDTARRYDGAANEVGLFVFPSIPPGQYRLSAESAGMDRWTGTFLLQTGQQAVIDITLKVSTAATEVVVTADVTPLLTTTSPAIGTVVERQRIEQLPLNGRNFQNLVAITTPGVEGASGSPRVFGLRAGSMEFIQDGASLTRRNINELTARPPGLDTINEFRVETAVSSAKFNRPASTIVSTRSGSNQFRGSAFWTGRNNGLGVARRRQDFFSKPPQLIRNEFGATYGGPVVLPKIYNGRNRTFFFSAWEQFKLRSNTTFGTTMPTMAMREGDFSGLIDGVGRQITIYDPWSTGPRPGFQRTPYPGNVIPPRLRSPLATYLYSVTPAPTLPNVNPLLANNYFGPNPNNQDHYTFTTRVDHRLTDNDQVFARYTRGNRILEQRRAFNNSAPITTDRLANFEYLPVYTQSGVFSWNRILSPTFFMETIFTGFHQDDNYNTGAPGLDENVAARLRLPNPFGAPGLPDATSVGFNLLYQGPRPRKDVTNIITLEQNFTKTQRTHQLEFGWRYRHEFLNVFPDQEQTQGSHSFNSLATALYDPASGAGTALTVPRTGHDSANFFLGVANQYSATFNRGWYYLRGKEAAGYLQDNWKITPNLSLNVGVRYEFFSPVTEANNVLMGFDVKGLRMASPIPVDRLIELGYTNRAIVDEFRRAGVQFASTEEAGLPRNLINPNWFDFSPRLGFAYRGTALGKSFSLRGGYGAYRQPPPLRTFNSRMRANPPMTANSRVSYNAAAQSPDGIPNWLLRSAPTVIAGVNSEGVLRPDSLVPFDPGSFGAAAFAPDQPTTTSHQWNMTLEFEVMKDTVARFGYVGTAGRNIDLWERLNDQPNTYVWFMNTGQPLPTGRFANTARRPLDQRTFGQIEFYTREGYSNFNSFTAEVQRRYRSGLSFQFFYTLSNALGTGNIATGNSAENAVFNPEVYLRNAVPQDFAERNRFLNYRRDTEIPQHRLRWNWLADLPIGKGKALLGDAGPWLNRLVGGWQLAGFGSWSSRWWQLPVTNWGELGNVEIYGLQHPIEDCRSGQCIQGYLYYNGYIPANRINSVDAQGRPNGVMGVPSNYRPAHRPIWPISADGGNPADPNFALLDTNQVFVTLSNGAVQRVGMDTNLHPWRNQNLPGPWIFNMSASLFKIVPVTEKVSLRFNADFFNVFNNPGIALPSSGNGILSLQNSAQGPRELQLTMRLNF